MIELVAQIADIFAGNLKAFRSKQGWTQEDLAKKSRISVEQIKKLETKKSWISPAYVQLLASAFGCDEADLFTDHSRTPQPTVGEALRTIKEALLEQHRGQQQQSGRNVSSEESGQKENDSREFVRPSKGSSDPTKDNHDAKNARRMEKREDHTLLSERKRRGLNTLNKAEAPEGVIKLLARARWTPEVELQIEAAIEGILEANEEKNARREKKKRA